MKTTTTTTTTKQKEQRNEDAGQRMTRRIKRDNQALRPREAVVLLPTKILARRQCHDKNTPARAERKRQRAQRERDIEEDVRPD